MWQGGVEVLLARRGCESSRQKPKTARGRDKVSRRQERRRARRRWSGRVEGEINAVA